MSVCTLCPRRCGVDRAVKPGFCGMGESPRLARAALHFWEEPCISGTKGSGTVFFAGCNLGCVYCQNRAISRGQAGREITPERLTEIFFELEAEGANNINLVTGDHFLPAIAGAVEAAKQRGIGIPFLLNTSSYLSVDTLKQLEGLIDIYLPDFKYIRDQDAVRYSRAPGYPEAAKAAIAEMVRQQPECTFTEEIEESREGKQDKYGEGKQDRFGEGKRDKSEEGKPEKHGDEKKEKHGGVKIGSDPEGKEITDAKVRVLTRGVVVRHLLLPGQLIQAKMIVRYLYETYGDRIFISLMSQFTPDHEALAAHFPEIDRKVMGWEYRSLVDYAAGLGVTNGFIQEGEAASDSFIPAFDDTGV